jgi:DNA-binding response OmpR family regulator
MDSSPAKRILVIEDDPIGQKVIVDALTAYGYAVSVARTGPEGVEKAARERPDLVVCDVLLPQKSGFEVCFEIKRAAGTRDVPVIFMSAVCRDTYSSAYASVDLRAQGYFVKPFSLTMMMARIGELLSPGPVKPLLA